MELNVKGDRGTDEALGLKSVNGWSDQNGDNSLGLAIKPSGARTESDGRYYGAGWVYICLPLKMGANLGTDASTMATP